MKKRMTCIVCPVGCQLTIDDAHNVSGNRCKRGIAYAIEEMTNPTRMLTSTVRVDSSVTRRLSVKTSKPIPKALLFAVMDEINQLSVKTPVQVGDILIKNVLDTGSDLVATRSLKD